MYSEKVKIARNHLGKKQKEMADLVGISQTAWQDYERGLRIPSSKAFEELSKLGFNVGWFFNDDVPMLKADPDSTNAPKGNPLTTAEAMPSEDIDQELALIVERWDKLPDNVKNDISAQVKELTKPRFLYESKVKKFKEYSQDRADFIWARGCKDAGIPMMYDHYAVSFMDEYKLKNISDADLYEASFRWAHEKLNLIQKIDKRNGNL